MDSPLKSPLTLSSPSHLPSLFELLCCIYTKYKRLGGLEATGNYFSQLCSPESPRLRHWQAWCVVRVCFLVHRQPSFHRWQKGQESSLQSLSSEHRSHSWGLRPRNLITSQRCPLQIIPPHCGVGFQHMNFGGNTNNESIVSSTYPVTWEGPEGRSCPI